MYDCIIIGGGPAGLSAAVALRSRNRSVLVLSNPVKQNPLYRAEKVDNYLGLPGRTGAQLMDTFRTHALEMGAELKNGRVLSAMDMGTSYFLTVGADVYEAKTLILASGIARGQKYPGEQALLGHGVSYCATCDGMLYRGKAICVVGRSKDAPQEANFLSRLGCTVTYVSPRTPEGLDDNITVVRAAKLEVKGEKQVEGLMADGTLLPCQGVFILRESVAPSDLLPGLALENGYIQVDRAMRTSLRNVFAAGDCTGKPLQISKAVGEGLIAGEAADEAIQGDA